MSRLIFVLIYGALASVLQGTMLHNFPAGQWYSIDLFLMAVAAIIFDEDWEYRWWCIFILGALKDSASAIPWGTSIVAYLLLGFVLSGLRRQISFQRGLASAFWTAVLSFGDKFVCFLVLLAIGSETAVFFLKRAPVQALGDGLASIVFVPVIIRLAAAFSTTAKKFKSKSI